mgnify:CR=1 FL=1
MTKFNMDSLVGSDSKGEDIISLNDEWLELDSNSYIDFYDDVKQDNADHLLELSKISGFYSISKNAKIHFLEYDVPVLIIEDFDTISALVHDLENTPGLIHDKDRAMDETAHCHRCRYVLQSNGTVGLFPFILFPKAPPNNLIDSPLLAHEMVHLRKTFTSHFNEKAIRWTYWNLHLQADVFKDTYGFLRHKIYHYLMEEHEALGQNNSNQARNIAIRDIYIPIALDECASIIDFLINDNKRYINISKIAEAISTALNECLINIDYNDPSLSRTLTPSKWAQVSKSIFKEAYEQWKKQPANFNQLLKQALSN